MVPIPISTEPSLLTTIKDGVQITVLVLGSLFGGLQLRAHAKNRRLQSLLAVLAQFQNEIVSQARWFAYEHHKSIDDLLTQPFTTEFERIHALNQFIRETSKGKLDLQKYRGGLQIINMIAFLIRKGYVHESVVPEYLETSFQRMYRYFHGWIVYRRTIGRIPLKVLGSDVINEQKPSRYCEHLEKLADSIERDGRLRIDRFAGIKEFLAALDHLGSERVGKEVLDRIGLLENEICEMKKALCDMQRITKTAPL